MTHSQDYIEGYRQAIQDLGREGDYRHVDWSAPYRYLLDQFNELMPKKADKFRGIRIVVNKKLPPNAIEFHHPNGRVDRFRVVRSS